MSKSLANMLFPNINKAPEDYLKLYPPRKKPAFRIAPSPTGHLHIGTLAMAFVNRRLADAHDGIFYLRIEDTDKKREMDGGVDLIVRGFEQFGIKFDEGIHLGGKYAPYKQSERVEIYHTFAKSLVERGRAFPCFCSAGDLDKSREEQTANKETPGYRGKYAKCLSLDLKTIEENIKNGREWCLRFRSDAKEGDRVKWHDQIRGSMSLPAQENHFIIVKSDGIPPYNFAHVLDDTLMRTSHVVRGEEWLPSTAEHIQIQQALFGDKPSWTYAHFPVIGVEEDGKRRKISKRKDAFALADFFQELGYPADAIKEYVLTLFNTDFEMWRIANPDKHFTEFEFRFEKIGKNSPLFDMHKLDHISRNVIARMTNKEIQTAVKSFGINDERVLSALAIDRETDKPRKDLTKFSEIPELFGYLFKHASVTLTDTEKTMTQKYLETYRQHPTREAWFTAIKELCTAQNFKVRDATQAIRKALTGRENTPDLYQIELILGESEVKRRLLK